MVQAKEYETILKGFLGRDSYLRYGPNNFPFITSESDFIYKVLSLT
jgi:hypothetical protein